MNRSVTDFLASAHISPEERILVALSGGADSTALLLSLCELRRPVCALHVHHGIRGAEADRDAEFCRELCLRLGIPFQLCRVDIPALARARGKGLEETAREERYRILTECADALSCSRIATAHNLEDNAETVLLHLVRGTGLSGLCGIPAVRGRLIRPLLSVSRKDIEKYLSDRGQNYVSDSTNTDTDLSRNRIRSCVMPELLKLNPAFPEAVFRMTETLSEDAAFMDALADGALSAAEIAGLPRPLALRRLRRAYTESTGLILSREGTELCLRLCKSENPSASVDLPGCRLRREYDRLIFDTLGTASSLPPQQLTLEDFTDVPEAGIRIGLFSDTAPENIHNSLTSFYVSCDRIDGHLTVRSRITGDTFQRNPRACRRSLKKIFIDDRIPAAQRDYIPVIADSSSVAAVYGYGADALWLPTPGSPCFRIEIRPLADESADQL